MACSVWNAGFGAGGGVVGLLASKMEASLLARRYACCITCAVDDHVCTSTLWTREHVLIPFAPSLPCIRQACFFSQPQTPTPDQKQGTDDHRHYHHLAAATGDNGNIGPPPAGFTPPNKCGTLGEGVVVCGSDRNPFAQSGNRSRAGLPTLPR